MSIYTPQKGESCQEILPPAERRSVIDELEELSSQYAKLELPRGLLDVYRRPPENPERCIFARTTKSITADLQRVITPCQFGGDPDCTQCGCVASAALEAVGRRRLPLGLEVAQLFNISQKIGSWVASVREKAAIKPSGNKPPINEAGY